MSIAFFIAAIILAITPGPGIAYVVARTAAGGRAEGLASCVGTGLGGLVHVVAAAFGVSVVIAESAIAFNVLKYFGAAYLIYLGVGMLRREDSAFVVEAVKSQGAQRAFREGILVEALNVKTALFFLAFLPQFVSPALPVVPQLIAMGMVCVVLNTLVDVVAVLAAARILNAGAARAKRAQQLNRVSGATMIALGAYLALARRTAP
jgi:threonine/homoserine/homoserine lactone efflux protein